MEELKKQVIRAHRRLSFQRFLLVLVWSLFATFMIAAIAIMVPKLWALSVRPDLWTWSWLGGALAAGCLMAGVWAWCTRRNMLDAAIEIDQRFGLKERVSSTFALSETDLQTEVGEALVADASRRVARLNVNEKFQVQTKWFNLLPVVPAAIALLLSVFVPDAISKPTPVTNAQSLDIKKRIQNSTDELKKKWAEQRKQAEQKDLKSAELFLKLEKGVGDLNKLDDVDKKKALVKLKDLEEEIKKSATKSAT